MVTDVSDEQGWKDVKNRLLQHVGGNSIPVIYVNDVEDGNVLILHHEHDGRDLRMNYAKKVVEHTKQIWENDVKLLTLVDDAPFEI